MAACEGGGQVAVMAPTEVLEGALPAPDPSGPSLSRHLDRDELRGAASMRRALELIGTAPGKVAALSFLMDAAHPHDIGTIVDSEGVAIRTGHHCAQPVMEHFGIAATARASLGMYNTTSDVDALVRSLGKVQELFG